MKIGYTYCSAAALDENTTALMNAGCERVLHDSLGQGRVSLAAIRHLLRAGDTLVVPTMPQAADSVQALDALVRDISTIDVDLTILADGWTAEALVHALAVLRSFPMPDGRLPGVGDAAPTAARRRRKSSQTLPEDEVLRRLNAGDKVNAIARDLDVTWAAIDRVRKRHQST